MLPLLSESSTESSLVTNSGPIKFAQLPQSAIKESEESVCIQRHLVQILLKFYFSFRNAITSPSIILPVLPLKSKKWIGRRKKRPNKNYFLITFSNHIFTCNPQRILLLLSLLFKDKYGLWRRCIFFKLRDSVPISCL